MTIIKYLLILGGIIVIPVTVATVIIYCKKSALIENVVTRNCIELQEGDLLLNANDRTWDIGTVVNYVFCDTVIRHREVDRTFLKWLSAAVIIPLQTNNKFNQHYHIN